MRRWHRAAGNRRAAAPDEIGLASPQPFFLYENDVATRELILQSAPFLAALREHRHTILHTRSPQRLQVLQHAIAAGRVFVALYQKKHSHNGHFVRFMINL